MKTGRQLSIDE
jgi:hypothetical protein